MPSLLFAGVVFAWVAAYVGIGVFFGLSYAIRRREPEFFVFGLASIGLAIYSAGIGLSYLDGDLGHWPMQRTLGAAGGIAAAPLLVHFALLFGEVRSHARWMKPAYATAAAFEVLNAAGLLWKLDERHAVPTTFFGLTYDEVVAGTTPLGTALVFLSGVAMMATVGLLGQAYLRGKKEALPALVGSAVLAGAGLHDAAFAADLASGPWLAPHGNMALAFGVALTLLIRYSRLSGELERRSRELESSYQTLREAQDELVKKEQLAAVGELAAVIAHEVRNPLAIIANATAGLRKPGTGSDDRAMLLEILDEESTRLNRLVGDLLRYARPVAVQRQSISVRELVDRALFAITQREGIEVEVNDKGDAGRIWADPDLLRQVFDNLVDNAVQAMTVAGTAKLQIKLRRSNREGVPGVKISVQDTGEGMDTLVRRRALDPFFTTRPSGTGLGLAIVDRIVEAHEGELVIESHAGVGTTVTVFLPVGSEGMPTMRPRILAGSERRSRPDGGRPSRPD